jgi:hypothetical protein
MLPGNKGDRHSRFKALLNDMIFSCVVRRLRFSGPKTSIICSPMTSLKTSIKTITYLSDIGCLEIQGPVYHVSAETAD